MIVVVWPGDHTLIVTVGTTGDVVPYVALGTGLREAGHRVTVATHPSLREHVDRAGLGFAPLPVEFAPTGPDAPPLTSARFARILAGRWLDIGRAVAGAATDADLIVTAAMGWIGYHVAQARGIPSVGAFLQPLWSGPWPRSAAASWCRQAPRACRSQVATSWSSARSRTPNCSPASRSSFITRGRAPPPLPARRLTPDSLAAAVDAADAATGYRAGAERTARRLSTEDGVGRAVAEIKRIQ